MLENVPAGEYRVALIAAPPNTFFESIRLGQTDVSIEGSGTVDGNGKPWWDSFWSRVPAYQERGLRWAVDYDVQRPELVRIYKSSAVHIGGGLLLRRSAFWTLHICYSNHVTVSGVMIRDNDPVDGKGPVSANVIEIPSAVAFNAVA